MLHLYGDTTRAIWPISDAICSSLQLINFLQDIAVDYRKDRIYLPQDGTCRHTASAKCRSRRSDTRGCGNMMMHIADRTRAQAAAGGAPLGRAL